MKERIGTQTDLINVCERDGQLVTDSREVAQMVGREHRHLLRDIRGYMEVLEDSPNLDSHNFFIEDEYINSQNKKQPCYLLTRKGCDMVANKMTGEKGILFTAEYVTRFEEMENKLQKPKSSMDVLKLHYEAISEIDDRVSLVESNFKSLEEKVEEKVIDLEENMPLFNVECDQIQKLVRSKGMSVLGGYKSDAYNDRSVRAKVYFDIQACIKREFGVSTYKGIKRKEFDVAKNLVQDYTPPLALSRQVYAVNNSQEVYQYV